MSAAAALEPGLFLDYRLEMLSEGRLDEGSVRLRVTERVDGDRWRLTLDWGKQDGGRYRAVYAAEGAGPCFAAERFSEVERWDKDWQPLDPQSWDLIAELADMETRLAGRPWEAESTLTVAGRDLRCRRYAFADTVEAVQQGESVTVRTRQVIHSEVWTSDALPLAGWVRYRQLRLARKTTEFAERRFEGKEESSEETWMLSDWGVER